MFQNPQFPEVVRVTSEQAGTAGTAGTAGFEDKSAACGRGLEKQSLREC